MIIGFEKAFGILQGKRNTVGANIVRLINAFFKSNKIFQGEV